MTYDPRKTVDLLSQTKYDLEQVRDRTVPLELDRTDVLGYAHKPGDVVLDKVSGKIVTIIDGQRADYVVPKEE